MSDIWSILMSLTIYMIVRTNNASCGKRQKTIQAMKLRTKIQDELAAREAEEKSLAEFDAEMSLLNQERLAHVDELRLIHNDIEQVSRLNARKPTR